MFNKIREMGILRNMLHCTAIIFVLLMPFAHGPQYSDSWNLFFGGILPASAPIIVIVIGLDLMMSIIWKSEASAERIEHLNSIIRAHLMVGDALLVSWLLVFLPVLVWRYWCEMRAVHPLPPRATCCPSHFEQKSAGGDKSR